MKKINLMTMVGIIALALISCNKENEIITELNEIDKTEQKILDFKDKITTKSNQKSEEIFEIDSVVWYIEATLNYTYCNPEVSDILNIDSVFINVPVSEDGIVTFSNVVNAYNDVYNGMNNIYNQTSGDNKKIQIADIEVVESNSKINGKTLKLTTFISDFHYKLPEPFYPNDYWHPMWGDGKCGDYEGEGIGCDGGTEIARHAAQFINLPFGSGYITDVNTQVFYGYQYTEYLWGEDLNYSTDACLGPNELTYWRNKLIELGNNHIPTNKSVIGYSIEGRNSLNMDPPYYFYHNAYVSYGKWHNSGVAEP